MPSKYTHAMQGSSKRSMRTDHATVILTLSMRDWLRWPLVMCMAWPQAKSQAKAKAKPSQIGWPGIGFGPGLYESQKPWPGPWLLTQLFETISGHHCHSIGDPACLRIKLIYYPPNYPIKCPFIDISNPIWKSMRPHIKILAYSYGWVNDTPKWK